VSESFIAPGWCVRFFDERPMHIVPTQIVVVYIGTLSAGSRGRVSARPSQTCDYYRLVIKGGPIVPAWPKNWLRCVVRIPPVPLTKRLEQTHVRRETAD
jgi:hypothetical protein